MENPYALADDGVAYVVADVPGMFAWVVEFFERHKLFRRRTGQTPESESNTPFARNKTNKTQRANKVDRGRYTRLFCSCRTTRRGKKV